MAVGSGLGTTIAKGATTIGSLTKIGNVEIKVDNIDTTTLDVADYYRTFIAGLIDAGEVAIEGYLNLADSGQMLMKTALDARTSAAYTITGSAVLFTWTFNAIITGFSSGEANLDDLIPFSATLKITGKPTFGVSASTGASAFVLRNAADDGEADAANYMPTWAIDTYYYAVTYTTALSVRPKVTAASHTIELFVDGVFSENLTTAVSGSAIAISADGSKELMIKCYEANKTPKVYRIQIARIS